MSSHQSTPKQWLVLNQPVDRALLRRLRQLPAGSGILLLGDLPGVQRRRLTLAATRRRLKLVEESRTNAVRVHAARELTRALLGRPRLVLVSPIHETSSHPDWKRLPRMRAAALARLAHREAVALGGMNSKRYARVARLGFTAWAGISAFRT